MAKKKPAKKTTKRKAKSKAKKKGNRSLMKGLFKFFFVAGLWVGIVLALVLAWYATELPGITESAEFERKTSIIMKDKRGKVLTRYGEAIGQQVTVADVPDHLVQAIMAIEDRRFYRHFGVDVLGVARAMVVNVQRGSFVQGGSTITQQLAKNLFLTRERTLKRKIQEAMLAIWLEYELSKDEILSAYLNRVYLGGGTYGVDAASNLYFNKSVKDITLRESAVLAGLLKAPSRYSPTNNPSLALQRSKVVLNAMAAAGYISEDEAHDLKQLPPKPNRKPTGADSVRYFTDWVVDGLENLIGTPQEDLIITTTLDSKAQEIAQSTLLKVLMKNGEAKNMSQGAIVMMAMDGSVVAIVGGRDYGLSQFNRATQAKRPPGSSFKPFVFLTALQKGWNENDKILDAKFTKGRYKPKNFGHSYYGQVSLRVALSKSLNTAAVRLAKAVGIGSVMNTAKSLGIYSEMEPDLSLALGSSGITLLEMATAYTVIGNGGYKVFPYGILKIEGESSGTVYYERPKRQKHPKVIRDNALRSLYLMMQSVVEVGSGKKAKTKFPVAGKTGTSQESRDALFVGFSDELATAVWLGNDDNSPMVKVTGGSYPAQIWRDVMTRTRGRHPKSRKGFLMQRGAFFSLLNALGAGNAEWDLLYEEGEFNEIVNDPRKRQDDVVSGSGTTKEEVEEKIKNMQDLQPSDKRHLSHKRGKRYND